MSNQITDEYYVFCKGWDNQFNEEIHEYVGPYATEQEALDFISHCHEHKHDEHAVVNIWKTGQPELLS